MGTILSYSLYCSVFLLCGCLAYRMMLSGEKQPGLNRAAIIAVYLVSFAGVFLTRLWPEPAGPTPIATAIATFDTPEPLAAEAVGRTSPLLIRLVPAIFGMGACVVLLMTAVSLCRLALVVRTGRRTRRGGVTTVQLDSCAVPFSFMHYVVLGKDDAQRHAGMIMAHESAHLRRHHWVDLLVAQAACVLMWYNPAAWLMRRELRTVHENQADEAVLQGGFDAAEYQKLLIEKAAGVRLESLANSLNHSNIYKRITMMNKQDNRAARRLRVLALAPALMLAAAATSAPAVASAIESVETSADNAVKAAPLPQTKGKVTKTVAYTQEKPASMPQFPGGEQELFKYLAMNTNYPAEAAKNGIQGRVVVSFTVGADGVVRDARIIQGISPELDREAIRVTESMPAWTPGRDKQGGAIACTYALPVNFRLATDDKRSTEPQPKVDKTLDDIVVVAYGSIKKDNAVKLQTEGADAPDYIVDGKPCSNITDIDPGKIESITVRKDDPAHPKGLVEIKMKK